jgi:hypothetical protein
LPRREGVVHSREMLETMSPEVWPESANAYDNAKPAN